jgi:hypothetical protein
MCGAFLRRTVVVTGTVVAIFYTLTMAVHNGTTARLHLLLFCRQLMTHEWTAPLQNMNALHMIVEDDDEVKVFIGQ